MHTWSVQYAIPSYKKFLFFIFSSCDVEATPCLLCVFLFGVKHIFFRRFPYSLCLAHFFCLVNFYYYECCYFHWVFFFFCFAYWFPSNKLRLHRPHHYHQRILLLALQDIQTICNAYWCVLCSLTSTRQGCNGQIWRGGGGKNPRVEYEWVDM